LASFKRVWGQAGSEVLDYYWQEIGMYVTHTGYLAQHLGDEIEQLFNIACAQ
jgi:hypothetical protein